MLETDCATLIKYCMRCVLFLCVYSASIRLPLSQLTQEPPFSLLTYLSCVLIYKEICTIFYSFFWSMKNQAHERFPDWISDRITDKWDWNIKYRNQYDPQLNENHLLSSVVEKLSPILLYELKNPQFDNLFASQRWFGFSFISPATISNPLWPHFSFSFGPSHSTFAVLSYSFPFAFPLKGFKPSSIRWAITPKQKRSDLTPYERCVF